MQLNIQSKYHSYPIVFSENGLASFVQTLKELHTVDSVVLGCNKTLLSLYGTTIIDGLEKEGVEVHLLLIPDGEQYKNIHTYVELSKQLDQFPIHRKTAFVALGGGVTGDMIGFLAATYLRGVPFVQVPTTLLAMVDSSVGGKVGVNTQAGKNRMGSFYPPILVFIAPDVLSTLPQEEWLCGFGEVLKHGALLDTTILDMCEEMADSIASSDLTNIPSTWVNELVFRNCKVKKTIVEQDEFERGSRAMLNLGHTVGHAIESALEHKVQHGICVAWGLLVELSWSVRNGVLSETSYQRIGSLIFTMGFPEFPRDIPTESLLSFAKNDKKRDGQGFIPITSLQELGTAELHSLSIHHLPTLFQPPKEISA